MIDLRRVRVGVEVNGQLRLYEGLRIRATGKKMADATKSECKIQISGLAAATRDYLLSEATPFKTNAKPPRLVLEAGRVSTGLNRIFTGDITAVEPGPPPDVDLIMTAKTGAALAYRVVATSAPSMARLSNIARTVADELGVSLQFEATDKNIGNWNYSGPAGRLVQRLNEAGGVRAFLDDDVLVVQDSATPSSQRVRILSAESGMVGIPKATEQGVKVQYLIDGASALGGRLRLQSRMNKPLNGDYKIMQLEFDIATHEDPFFYTAHGARI